MTLMLPWKRISIALIGQDVHVAVVRRSPLGATVEAGPILTDALAAPAEELRKAVRGFPNAPITLVCPASWCAVRPIQLSVSDWKKARSELVRSIDRLLPIPPDDALAGLVNTASDGSGLLVAIRRSRVQPWLDLIERVFGRPVQEVVAPQMAMLGLGLQGREEAVVCESGGPSSPPMHRRLRFGRPIDAGEPAPTVRSDAALLPDESNADEPERVGPVDLALAAALIRETAPGEYAPLIGQTPSPARRWAPPAILGAAAALLLLAAGPTFAARLDRATDAMEEQRRAMEEEVERVLDLRARAERFSTLLEQGVASPTRRWRSVLTPLVDMHEAFGAAGFVHRLEIRAESVSVRGEAPQATAVLERLESSDLLTGAAFTSPVSKAGEADVLEIRAERREGP